MKDLHNKVLTTSAVDATLETGTTAMEGHWIDRQGYESLEFAITATLPDSDGTLTPLVEDSEDPAGSHSDKVAVADADLLGTEAGATYAAGDDGVVKKIGYIGDKRYVRLTLTPAANSGNLVAAAIAILGNPHLAPIDDQEG